MRTLAVTAAILLAGCASEMRHIRGPDGQQWMSITCRRSQANCFERAGQECPNGYVVGDQTGHEGAFVQTTRVGYNTIGTVTPVYHGEMLARCKVAGE